MSLRYVRPPAASTFSGGTAVQTVIFATIPPIVTIDYCIQAINEAAEAIRRATSSGVVEYNIGSRGLKRFTIAELKEAYTFWKDELQNVMLEGAGSSIQSRRAVPCDV
jgi:hypothetical protein